MEKTVAPPPKPEIDPEVAEIEANAMRLRSEDTGHSHAEVSRVQKLINGLVGRQRAKGDPTQGPKNGAGKGVRDSRNVAGKDRRLRRAMERMGTDPDRTKRPHARIGRAKVSNQQHRLAAEFRQAARKQLVKVKLTTILPHCPDLKYVIGQPGIKNVWQLSQQTTATINAISGLGPKRRKAILDYLHSHQVPTKWTA